MVVLLYVVKVPRTTVLHNVELLKAWNTPNVVVLLNACKFPKMSALHKEVFPVFVRDPCMVTLLNVALLVACNAPTTILQVVKLLNACTDPCMVTLLNVVLLETWNAPNMRVLQNVELLNA
jgi:hypothetical protein